VNVHLQWIVNNLKTIRKMSTLPPWKNFCGRLYLLCIRECPQLVLYDILKLKTLGVQAREPPTACTSGDCELLWLHKTWREKVTSGHSAFAIFERLWQTCALENKAQLWPIYAVLSEDYSNHKILSLKFMHSFVDDYGSVCLIFAFSFTGRYNSNVISQFGMGQYNSLKIQS